MISFGPVLSDLRFPVSVGCLAGAAIVEGCEGRRELEMYDRIRTHGMHRR